MTLTVEELKELILFIVGSKGIKELQKEEPISRKVLNEFLDKQEIMCSSLSENNSTHSTSTDSIKLYNKKGE